MNSSIQPQKSEIIVVSDFDSTWSKVFNLLHLALTMFALYLAFQCKGTNAFHFLFAICCPYIYIPYALATSCKGIVKLPFINQ